MPLSWPQMLRSVFGAPMHRHPLWAPVRAFNNSRRAPVKQHTECYRSLYIKLSFGILLENFNQSHLCTKKKPKIAQVKRDYSNNAFQSQEGQGKPRNALHFQILILRFSYMLVHPMSLNHLGPPRVVVKSHCTAS